MAARQQPVAPGAVPADVPVPRGFQDVLDRYPNPRILDFGCGYGRSIIDLLIAGFDVRGADISEEQLGQARVAFTERDLDPGRLVLLDEGGHVPFPDESFDVIFSTQVLEHVADLDLVAAEIARLLRPGGATIHDWPARWRLVEPHLRMPLLHWLPKNKLRRGAIHFWSLLGIGPPWPPQLDPTAGRRAHVEFNYRYSVDETFYRPPKTIEQAFRRHGLEIGSVREPRAESLPPVLRQLALLALRTFIEVRTVARKPGPTTTA